MQTRPRRHGHPGTRAPGAHRSPGDLLSLDTGSTPDLSVPGAREHTTPVKPVSDFHARWQAIRERLASGATADDPADDPADGPTDDPFDGAAARPLSIGVIGSGAGGFELIMAMRHALPPGRAECHWVLRRDVPLAGRPPRLGERALAAARRAGVAVHADFDVVRVREEGVEARDGRFLKLDETLWCTAATGPEWPAAAGLATDERGFVATDRHLRSVSHPHLFATGDIGTQRDTPSAKAGVFAVRQAPVLFENLRRTLLGEPLERYVPQRDFLSLMATGGRSAIASRGPFVVEGRGRLALEGSHRPTLHGALRGAAADDAVAGAGGGARRVAGRRRWPGRRRRRRRRSRRRARGARAARRRDALSRLRGEGRHGRARRGARHARGRAARGRAG